MTYTHDTKLKTLKTRLESLRNPKPANGKWPQFDKWASTIRTTLTNSNLTLSDIGTSERELQALRPEFFRKGALFYFGLLRTGDIFSTKMHPYSGLLECVSEAGLSPEDINTSKKELQTLLDAFNRRTCVAAMGRLRNAETIRVFSHYLKKVEDWSREDNLTLEDIGASQEEIDILKAKVYKPEAVKILSALRLGNKFGMKNELYSLFSHLTEAKLSLEDIGSSQEEIDGFAILVKEGELRSVISICAKALLHLEDRGIKLYLETSELEKLREFKVNG